MSTIWSHFLKRAYEWTVLGKLKTRRFCASDKDLAGERVRAGRHIPRWIGRTVKLPVQLASSRTVRVTSPASMARNASLTSSRRPRRVTMSSDSTDLADKAQGNAACQYGNGWNP